MPSTCLFCAQVSVARIFVEYWELRDGRRPPTPFHDYLLVCHEHVQRLVHVGAALPHAGIAYARVSIPLEESNPSEAAPLTQSGRLAEYADRLRANLEPEEEMLWEQIKDSRLTVPFYAQAPLLGYIPDFYCPEAGLVVEIDGGHHEGDPWQREYDRRRTDRFESEGIEVLRFSNDAVRNQLTYVILEIARAAEARLRERSGSA